MLKSVARKYASIGLLILLIVVSTLACSSEDVSQGDEFHSLRTLDEARAKRAPSAQKQEDPQLSNSFTGGGLSYYEIQDAVDRFYSNKSWEIDSSYREALSQLAQRESSCYDQLMSSNVADHSISDLCDFSFQRQKIKEAVNRDYDSLWNQVTTFENNAQLNLGSGSFDTQYRLEDELNRIGGTMFIEFNRYGNEIQQDIQLKEDSIYRAESECETGDGRSVFTWVECENNDQFGINNSFNSGFGLDDQDCDSRNLNCQQSDQFGINTFGDDQWSNSGSSDPWADNDRWGNSGSSDFGR